ncbi:DNA translocase FtsK [Psychrobacillus sp. NPDC058041]|uniref:DNA translocase FtsK n=1 Tax=Psychrobacillus sp. NPDC058041 TaxID=3346310 RepID=UPI0036DE332A
MKWFKKLFAINDVENREEQIVEVEQDEELVTRTNSRTPFRFPLIPDEEKNENIYSEPKTEKNIGQAVKDNQLRDEQPYKPLHTQELWQKRKQEPIVHCAPKKEIVESPVKETRKKAFTPTQVPSPVFGFSRKQEKIIEETIESKVTENENEQTFRELAITELPKQEVEKVTTATVTIEEKGLLSQHTDGQAQDSPIEPVEEVKPNIPKENIRPFNALMLKSDKEKMEETVESKVTENEQTFKELAITELPKQEVEKVTPATVTIEKKELLSQTTDGQAQDNPIEPVAEVKPNIPKENIRPFNVLMLKSDKEKMNKLVTEMPVYQPEIKPVVSQITVQETESKPEYSSLEYTRPDISYLLPPEMKNEDKEWMEEQALTLVEALSHFQVAGEIIQTFQGPAVTQFELTVGHGTKVSKIRNLADDLKLALAAKDIRIQAPIPGKSSIGIEIPNRKSRAVRLSEVINTSVFLESDSPLEAALGLDLTGKPVTLDLRKMPHGLIAGATGSGKSVFINSLLVSLIYKASPEEVKLLLIDPKMVELAPFNHIPHLVSPVITDVKAATAALKWAVEEMERRYQLFAHIGVRDINRYNSLATEKRQFAQKLPFIVIVIDELADLMMMAPTEVEDAICRIAQKARACGIHLVLATQRPSVDVITGLIKANIPTRIAFSVSSQIDSRTILDQQGAERLLGKGDMLYQGNGMSSPVRIQGTYVSDEEIENIIDYARSQGTPEYMFEQEELLQKAENVTEQDELFEEACRFIVEQGSASTSLLQRKFHLGYNRAARLIDAMYENGYITEQKGSKAREVLLTDDNLEQIFS